MDDSNRADGATTTAVELAARPDAAGTARRMLDPLGERLSCEVVERAQLLVTELIANSLLHAERHLDDSIRLQVEQRPSTLRVQVTDSGPGFEPKIHTPTMYQHSGWGLFLMDQLSDRWGVSPTRDEVAVWFELDLDERTPVPQG